MRSINKRYKEITKCIRKHKLVEPYFVHKYSFSPYQACEHACQYCDGRAEKYYVEGDFEKDIVIRRNVAEVLARELPKIESKEKGNVLIGSGISDLYQPVEREEMLMRTCAEVLSEHGLPVSVMTKSALILRDLDLWLKVNQKSGFMLMVSLTLLDDQLRRVFEPGAASVQERLSVLKTFKENGCVVGVVAMPFLPGLSDTRENINNLITTLQDIGVDFVLPSTLTLRPGKQKDLFLSVLRQEYPDLVAFYLELYKENKPSGSPHFSYRQKFYKLLEELFSEHQVHSEIRHELYQNKIPLYDEIYILLCHMDMLYSRKGVDTKPLQDSLKKYTHWLLERKKEFNRKRRTTYQSLEQELAAAVKLGHFADLVGNEKLTKFLASVICDRKTFDYGTLKLGERTS